MSTSALILIGVIVVAVLMIAIAATTANRSVARRGQARRRATTTSEKKKKEPFSVSKVLKQILMGAIVVILLLFLARLVLSFFSEDEKRVEIRGSTQQQVQLVDTISYSPYGTSKIMLGKEYSKKFCPPKRSYMDIKRKDKSVGLTYLPQRRINEKWSEAIPRYEPPGKEIHLGYLICLKIKSDTPTSATVIISETPL